MTRAERLAARTVAAPRRAVAELAGAVGFLTRVPVRALDPERTGAAAYGLVGAAVGAVGAAALLVLGGPAPYAASALAVGAIAVVSGALHLDGLADTADALAAPNAAASDRARKDPATGPAGVAAIAIVLLVDVGLLGALAAGPGSFVAAMSCLVAAAGSRAAPVLMVAVASPAASAPADGLGGWFAAHTSRWAALLAAGSALTLAFVAVVVVGDLALVLGVVGGLAIAVLVGEVLLVARRGLDGDALGALVEIAFAAALLVTVLAI